MKYASDFFYNSKCPLLICNNDQYSTIIKANQAFYDLIGYTQEEFRYQFGNHFSELVVDNVDNILKKIKLSIKTKGKLDYEYRLRCNDGHVIWVHDIANYDESENLFYVSLMDVTYRKNEVTILEKKQSKSQLNMLISSVIGDLSIPVGVYDSIGVNVFSNPCFKNLIDYCVKSKAVTSHQKVTFFDFLKNITKVDSKSDESIFQIGDLFIKVMIISAFSRMLQCDYTILVLVDVSDLKNNEAKLNEKIAENEKLLSFTKFELKDFLYDLLAFIDQIDINAITSNDHRYAESIGYFKSKVGDIVDELDLTLNNGILSHKSHLSQKSLYKEFCPVIREFEKVCEKRGITLTFRWEPSNFNHAYSDWRRLLLILQAMLNVGIYSFPCNKLSLYITARETGLCLEVSSYRNKYFDIEHEANNNSNKRLKEYYKENLINSVKLMSGEINRYQESDDDLFIVVDISIEFEPVCFNKVIALHSERSLIAEWLKVWKVSCIQQQSDVDRYLIEHKMCTDDIYPDLLFEKVSSLENELIFSNNDPIVIIIDNDSVDKILLEQQVITLSYKSVFFTDVSQAFYYLKKLEQSGSVNAVKTIFINTNMRPVNGLQLARLFSSDSKLCELPIIIYGYGEDEIPDDIMEYGNVVDTLSKPYYVSSIRQALELL